LNYLRLFVQALRNVCQPYAVYGVKLSALQMLTLGIRQRWTYAGDVGYKRTIEVFMSLVIR